MEVMKLNTFYYDIDYTVGDKHDDNMLYFHAYFNRQNPTVLLKDYEILPRVHGRGRFIGANIGVRTSKERYFKSWWGEGEVKIYLDGDEEHTGAISKMKVTVQNIQDGHFDDVQEV